MIKCKHEISTKLIILLLCLISTIALFIRIQYINHTDVYKPIRADARQYVLYYYTGITLPTMAFFPSKSLHQTPPLLIPSVHQAIRC